MTTCPKSKSQIEKRILANLSKPMASTKNHASHLGLCIDLLVLERVIKSIQPKSKIRRVTKKFCGDGLDIVRPGRNSQKIRIHVEHIHEIQKGYLNIFIPNHELQEDTDLKQLPRMHYILCKTHYGYDAFKRYLKRKHLLRKVQLIYIGFTGIPGILPRRNIKRSFDQCLHLAGKSWMKNTGAIIDAWKANWPHLTIVCVDLCREVQLTKRRMQKCSKFKNITLHTKYLPFQDVANLREQCGIHFLVSEQEGYGMYIQESMMSGAVCIYSDHGPMNEFFTKGSGIPVKGKKFRHHEGVLPGIMGIKPNSRDITNAMNRVLRMSTRQKVAMGIKARKVFATNRCKFIGKATMTFGKILSKKN